VKEADLEKYAELRAFPIIPCNLCGSQPNLKRAEMKALIRDWEKRFPGRVDNMFNALANVVPSHLMDAQLFPFAGLRATGNADPLGDIAFDDEPCSTSTAGPSSGGRDGEPRQQPISFAQFDDL
jgi:tRNA 2-thiocytidine biosynthesis protein TtcA